MHGVAGRSGDEAASCAVRGGRDPAGCRAGGPGNGRGSLDRRKGAVIRGEETLLRDAPIVGNDRERGHGDPGERRIFGWVNPYTSCWIIKGGC